VATVVDRARLVLRCETRGFAFDVQGDAEVGDLLADLFAALERDSGDADAVFSLGRADGEGTRWQVHMDGKLMMACEQRGEALHGLVVFINERVWKARDDLLSIHAAAVATNDGAVILPGDSGSGKTTLCARLLQHGAAYLSDDSVALDHAGRVLGYPKPLGFKGATQQQFADAGLAVLEHELQLVWQVPPSRLGATSAASAQPAAVVLPRFEPGASLRVEPIPPQAGAGALFRQVQNLPAFGVSEALEVIGRLVARVPSHAIVYGDAREAAPVVLGLVGPTKGETPAPRVVVAGPPVGSATEPFPAADLHAVFFEEGALLVRADSREFVTVDGMGALIWPMLDGHRTVGSISAELAPSFGAAPSAIEADIAGWVRDLVDRGFLVVSSDVSEGGGRAESH
jgi:hypothetical protein